MKFPSLPTLPPGVQPSDAELVGTPIPDLSVGANTGAFEADGIARHRIDARGLLEPWIGSSKLPGQYTALADDGVAQLILRPQVADSTALLATLWPITERVQQWYANPATNYGLLLRLSDPDETYMDVVQTLPSGVGRAFNSCFPKTPGWSSLDGLSKPQPTTDGSGLGLLIHYFAAPLAASPSASIPIDVPSVKPDGTFRDQAHEYQLPSNAGRWRVVAAQGLFNQPAVAKTALELLSDGASLKQDTLGTQTYDAQQPFQALDSPQPSYIVVKAITRRRVRWQRACCPTAGSTTACRP